LPALSHEFLNRSLAKEELREARVSIVDGDFTYAWDAGRPTRGTGTAAAETGADSEEGSARGAEPDGEPIPKEEVVEA
jgi:type VI secretion system protein VasG